MSQPSLFDDPAKARRSRALMTVFCVFITLLLLAVAAVPVWLIWWAFTIHERR